MPPADSDIMLKTLTSALVSYFEGGGRPGGIVLTGIGLADFKRPMLEFFPDAYLKMCAAGWF